MNKFQLANIDNGNNSLTSILNREYDQEKPMILFGAGSWGINYSKVIKEFYPNILFCDNNQSKWGTKIEGIPVISFEEMKIKYRDCPITITSMDYYDQILQLLAENHLQDKLQMPIEGFTNGEYNHYFELITKQFQTFTKAYELLADELSRKIFYERINCCITADQKYLIPLRSRSPQYFEPGIITLSKDEIFIDGGGYTGDTVEEFLKQTNSEFRKIYSFEPEIAKHKEYSRNIMAFDNFNLLPFGLWSNKEVLRFNAENTGSSHVSEQGDTEIQVISVDEVLEGNPVTFIKMDIEGAELEALKGAANSIRKYKPKLAICVYHKPLDIAEIPLYLKELVPEYKIYLRHYNINIFETVCYAVAE